MNEDARRQMEEERRVKKMKKSIYMIFAGIIVVCGVFYIATRPPAPGKYDTFAACIKESGATFYGAFWCPHCLNQKKMFGNSERLLPYVECSLPDARNQTPICIEKKIETYPTWEFKDGSRLSGEISLKTLSEKTGCALPL